MKVHRDLVLDGDTIGLNRVRAALEQIRHPNWQRDVAAEVLIGGAHAGAPTVLVYKGTAHPAAGVCLFWELARASVANIVPRDKPTLSADEYNAIARAFTDEVLRGPCAEAGVAVRLGATEESLENTFRQT